MEVSTRAYARRLIVEHLSADVALRYADGPLAPEAWRRAFEARDLDHDGQLTARDFAAWLTETGMAPLDRDTLLEAAELPARLVIADFFAELEVRLCLRRATVPRGGLRCDA
jgi:hypothetical protein